MHAIFPLRPPRPPPRPVRNAMRALRWLRLRAGRRSRLRGSKSHAGTGTPRVPSEEEKAEHGTQDKPMEKSTGQPEANSEKDCWIFPRLETSAEDGAGFVDAMHDTRGPIPGLRKTREITRTRKSRSAWWNACWKCPTAESPAAAGEKRRRLSLTLTAPSTRRAAEGAEK